MSAGGAENAVGAEGAEGAAGAAGAEGAGGAGAGAETPLEVVVTLTPHAFEPAPGTAAPPVTGICIVLK